MTEILRALLVEDSEDDALLLVRSLRRGDYELHYERVDTLEAMEVALAQGKWDVVIADYALPKFSGLAALKLLKQAGLDLPFIIVSGTIGEDLAVAAMKAGAHDYLMKGELTRLIPAVNREIQEAQGRQARRDAEAALRRRAEELAALHTASLTITAPHDFQSLLRSIIQQAKALLHAAAGSVSLCSPEQRQVRVYEESGMGLEVYVNTVLNYGEGAAGKVAESGEPLVIDDYRTWPNRAAVYEATHPYSAVLSVPLAWHNQVIGVLQVMDDEAIRLFTQHDVELLSLFADQAAIAIENARLFQQATTERRHLGLLYDLGRELASTLDHNEILSRAVMLTNRALGGLVGEAFLYIPELDLLRLNGLYGRESQTEAPGTPDLELAMGQGLAGWVAQERKPINVEDVKNDPRWLHVPGLDEDVHSALAAPIMDSERLLGVLTVLHQRLGAFTEDHLDLLQAICHQVSLALNNADSYEQIQSLVDLLAAEQYRLESLVERLPVGVLLLDSDYRLLIANLLGRQMLSSVNPIEPGQKLNQLGPYPVAMFCDENADTAPSRDEQAPLEVVLEGPPHLIIEVEARPIGGDDRQWVITLRDVTKERNEQDRIRTHERLATVGQLAAGIAHDFNNIMAAILVYTDLLMGDKSMPAASRERLQIIQQQVQRATSLIRQILDFSRRSVMEQTPMDLLPFVKELDKLLSRVLPETIRLELTYQPGMYQIRGDPTRLQQVFMNLALNARDAMPQGGNLCFNLSRVSVSTGDRVRLPELGPGEWVRVCISDSGLGIAPEVLPHIFDPFFTTKPVGKGTGLGLAQVYGIVRQHQGYIDVSSQPGQGSEFVIYLPMLKVAELVETAQERPADLDGGGQTVLVVEDDQATREALQALLQAQGFAVMVANNGVEALDLYEKGGGAFALVIADLVMPEMGGAVLHQTLREHWPEVKMLFVTGHPLEMRDQMLLEKGDVSWLQKPFSVQEFNTAIQTLLG